MSNPKSFFFPFSHRQLKEKLESSRISQRSLPGVTPFFHVENLVKTGASTQWKRVGYINGSEVQINAIFWPGRGYKGVSEQNKRLRVALAEAPPFVMTSSLIENATCLLGVVCLRVSHLENSFWNHVCLCSYSFAL